jgi:hypothetical protein
MDEASAGTPRHIVCSIADDPFSLLLVFSSWWWGGWTSLLWPAACGASHACSDAHAQLVVPDPIAEEGDHALFA